MAERPISAVIEHCPACGCARANSALLEAVEGAVGDAMDEAHGKGWWKGKPLGIEGHAKRILARIYRPISGVTSPRTETP